ncbi:winged helix-turn-helix domain-containing protein [Acinetobacter vivianii]|uniref:winged helix-turn-helix domain-containing protein n=1 Tax=Acinetobacter vivianii TaxID=1776742 RepID=UPI0040428657
MSKPRLKMHLRILSDEQIAFGPGKAELLEAIQRTGSISQAAKSMDMSYRRAWQLVDTMNQCFQSHLVETQTGGTHGGGAIVTELGQVILKKFRGMEQQAIQSVVAEFEDITKYLK